MKPGGIINGVSSPYCLGLIETRYRGDRNIGHSGGMAGGRSEGVRFPELDLYIVILANTDDIRPFSMARRIVDLVQGRPAGPPQTATAAAGLNAAAGLYHDEATDDVFALVPDGKTPLFTNTSGTYEVEQIAPDVFTPEFGVLPLNLTLRPDCGMDASRFDRPQRFKRLQTLDIQFDHRAVGRYGDAALGITAEIVLENAAAWLTISTTFASRRCVLEPITPNLSLARSAPTGARKTDGSALELVPWRFAVRTMPDAIVINTEWTCDCRERHPTEQVVTRALEQPLSVA